MFPNTQNSSKFSLKVKSAILDLGALFPLTARLRRKQLSVLFSRKISFLRQRLRAGLCLTENCRQTPPKTDSKKQQEEARQKMRRTKKRRSSQLPMYTLGIIRYQMAVSDTSRGGWSGDGWFKTLENKQRFPPNLSWFKSMLHALSQDLIILGEHTRGTWHGEETADRAVWTHRL